LIKLGEGDTVSDVASVRAEDEDLGGGNESSPKDNGDGKGNPSGEKKNLKTKTEVKKQAGSEKSGPVRRTERAGSGLTPAAKADGKKKAPRKQSQPRASSTPKRASPPQRKTKRQGRR
jgi:hypothetical protein